MEGVRGGQGKLDNGIRLIRGATPRSPSLDTSGRTRRSEPVVPNSPLLTALELEELRLSTRFFSFFLIKNNTTFATIYSSCGTRKIMGRAVGAMPVRSIP